MKCLYALASLLLFISAHAQQYGWVHVAQPTTDELQAVEFADSLHGWTAWGSTNIFRTTNGGTTWTAFSATPFVVSSISMIDRLTGWCVGTQGTSPGRIVRTTNGGTSWVEQLVGNDRNFLGTFARTKLRNTTSGRIDAPSIDTGVVVQTTNGGTTWTERTIADSIHYLSRVQFTDSLHGWILSLDTPPARSHILRTTDGGVSWGIHQLPEGLQFSFIDSLRGWGAVDQFRVYKTTDGGITWQFIYNGISDDLGVMDFEFVDGLNGWAFGITFMGGIVGAIFHTTDGGYGWTRESVGQLYTIRAARMLDRYHGWAVGDGGVLRYQLVSSAPERLPELPKTMTLRQNYPNPFNASTTIEYEITERQHVALTIHDALGKEVSKLIDADQEAGVYRIRFEGSHLASGVYYYTLTTGSLTTTRQMTILK